MITYEASVTEHIDPSKQSLGLLCYHQIDQVVWVLNLVCILGVMNIQICSHKVAITLAVVVKLPLLDNQALFYCTWHVWSDIPLSIEFPRALTDLAHYPGCRIPLPYAFWWKVFPAVDKLAFSICSSLEINVEIQEILRVSVTRRNPAFIEIPSLLAISLRKDASHMYH